MDSETKDHLEVGFDEANPLDAKRWVNKMGDLLGWLSLARLIRTTLKARERQAELNKLGRQLLRQQGPK
jgi:hypothetical protein